MNKSEPILRPRLYKIAHNARSSRRASWARPQQLVRGQDALRVLLSLKAGLYNRRAARRGCMKSSTIARRWKSGRPSIGSAGLLLFARFRWREQPTLRGTIKLALFLPSARPTFWGTPNNPRLPKKLGAVRLNPLRDVALQTIGLDASILRYRDRSKHRGGHNNS